MLTLPRLTIVRQRRVAQSLAEVLADKNKLKSLRPEVKTALEQVVSTGAQLDAGRELPPLLLDSTTDSVWHGFEAVVEGIQRALDDGVIKPLAPELAKKKAAASLLELRVFPDGAGFLGTSMPLQYDAMVDRVDLLTRDHEVAAAVKELGVGYVVQHLEAHLGPYGRAVKSADGRDLEAASATFHAAFVQLAVQVAAHHAGDDSVDRELLGAYRTEMTAQREEERLARRRVRARQAAHKTA
jgi:hypothetical protein